MAGSGAAAGSAAGLHPLQELLVAVELALPVAIHRRQPTFRAAASDIQPTDVLAFGIQRDTNRALELLLTARASALLFLGFGHVRGLSPIGWASASQAMQTRMATPASSSSSSPNTRPPHLHTASAKCSAG